MTPEVLAAIREHGLAVYYCPTCRTPQREAWHSLNDGGLIPQAATEHDCVRIDVGALVSALAELVADYEEMDTYPTSDGHPLYAAREALTGSRFRLGSTGEVSEPGTTAVAETRTAPRGEETLTPSNPPADSAPGSLTSR